ncbi:alpha/beta fold hydrolase [Pseudonocardia sp. GCM10023141]|uniref:alpha/beta fold hydrolase n=1 Tax=Pseudonocardia sp. GCM10023141 TaxID=3252653 RepID=UPI003609A1DF
MPTPSPRINLVAEAIVEQWLSRALRAAARRLSVLPGPSGVDLDEAVTALDSFADRGARSAFVHTIRSVPSWSGRRWAGTGRFSVLTGIPVLLVTGRSDAVIPAAHTRSAHEHLPGSRLEVLRAGRALPARRATPHASPGCSSTSSPPQTRPELTSSPCATSCAGEDHIPVRPWSANPVPIGT